MPEQTPRPASKIERFVEALIYQSRWLLALLYIGLIIGIVALIVRFGFDLAHLVTILFTADDRAAILDVLNLIDLTLVANLVLIVMFSGYESFVSRIDSAIYDRPAWMGTIDFTGLKIKLMASLAAISGIYLLEALLNLASQTWTQLAWKLGIHLTFVVSGVFFALMERIETAASHGGPPAE